MTEGQGAAVEVGLVRVDSQLVKARERLGREGLVEFHQAHVRGRQSVCRQEPFGRRGRADAQQLRRHPGGVGSQDQQPVGGAQLPGPLHGRDNDGGGTVGVEAGVPGRDRAAAGKNGRETGHQGRAKTRPRTVVGCRGRPGAGGEGHDFGVERPGGRGGQGTLVAAEREGVLAFPADAEAGGDVLGRHPHVGIAEAQRRELGPAVKVRAAVVVAVGAERSRADALDAAREVQAAAARRDQPGGQDDRVQTGAALPVHGDAGDGDRQARLQRGEPGHVSAAAHGVADHDVGHGFRRGRRRHRRAGCGAPEPGVRGRGASSGPRWRGTAASGARR